MGRGTPGGGRGDAGGSAPGNGGGGPSVSQIHSIVDAWSNFSKRRFFDATFGVIRISEPVIISIVSGEVTVTSSSHVIAAQSGTTDNLDTINGWDMSGMILYLRADTGDTITIKHGTGNIKNRNDQDIILDAGDLAILYYDLLNEEWEAVGDTTANTTRAGVSELATAAEAATGTDTARVPTVSLLPVLIQDSKYVYAASSTGNDSYAITLTPAPAGYVTGQVFHFKPDTANAGTATLNVNSLGAKTILMNHDLTLDTDAIEANQIVTVIYDGTNFQMQSQSGNAPGDVTAAANMTDNTIIKGDGGAKGVQDSGITISDADQLGGVASLDATTEATIEAAIDTLANLVTTGALNSGSITSGFGNINIGTSVLTSGLLQVDDISINGNSISSGGASSLTLIAFSGQAVSVEGVTFDGTAITGGSITSGFGSIDTGSSTITTTGTASLSNVSIASGSIELHHGTDTIATDEIASPTGGYIIAAAESGTTDDLDGIGGGANGRIIVVRADAGDVITLKHSDAGAGTGRKLLTNDNASVTLTGNDEDSITFMYDESLDSSNGAWFEIARGEAAAGGGGSGQDLDSDTLWAAAGDLVKGTADNTADILSIGADHTILVSNGSAPLWSAIPPLAGIADTGDTTRITIATSGPHVQFTGEVRFDAFGGIGIGTDPSSTRMLDIETTETGVTNNRRGLIVSPTLTWSAAGKDFIAISGDPVIRPAGNNMADVIGMAFVVGIIGTGTFTITDAIGARVGLGFIESSGAMTMTNVSGFKLIAATMSGTPTITSWSSFHANIAFVNSAYDGIGTYYGFRQDAIPSTNVGSSATLYGLYIGNLQDGGGNAYGIYVENASTYGLFIDAGLSRFDGDGTHVFELPADATDPTPAFDNSDGRIPILIGGSLNYLAYYNS